MASKPSYNLIIQSAGVTQFLPVTATEDASAIQSAEVTIDEQIRGGKADLFNPQGQLVASFRRQRQTSYSTSLVFPKAPKVAEPAEATEF